MPLLNSLKNYCLDLIFPIKCLGCNNFSDKYLCRDCAKIIPTTDMFHCLFCNARSSYTQICLKCGKNHALNQCLSAVSYKNPLVRSLIQFLKYRFVKDISTDISLVLLNYLERLREINLVDLNPLESIIVPVPLHKKRLRWRSFNQAELIAKSISSHFKVKIKNNILLRISNNKPQAKIEIKKERRKNIKNVFCCRKNIAIDGKTIFLIDDLITTGSTLNECAKILKKSGARKVIGITFARG